MSIWLKRSRRDTSKSEVFLVLGALRCTQKSPRRQARMGRCRYICWLWGNNIACLAWDKLYYFSMVVVGYMVKFQARFVLQGNFLGSIRWIYPLDLPTGWQLPTGAASCHWHILSQQPAQLALRWSRLSTPRGGPRRRVPGSPEPALPCLLRPCSLKRLLLQSALG